MLFAKPAVDSSAAFSWVCVVARAFALLAPLVLNPEALAQTNSATQPATVRPLDGRPPVVSAINAVNRTPGTVVRVMRGDQVLRTLNAVIPIKLPKEVLQSDGSVDRLNLNASAQKFVIDPDLGEWYSLIDTRPGYTLTWEGDNRLVAQSQGCNKPSERDVFLGSTDTLVGKVTDRTDGPKKEILTVADCIPYRAVAECDEAGNDCDHKYKPNLTNVALTGLKTVRQLDIPENVAPRALTKAATGPTVPAKRSAQTAAADGFQYHAPGRTLIRQYGVPAKCGDVLVGKEFFVERMTPYSRLVFAGPSMMKRFPIVLPADKLAYANSQIFAPGGGFFATSSGEGWSVDKLRKMPCDSRLAYDETMGDFGAENKFDARNFHPPWADTFCEWRGNSYTQPFCAAEGQKAMGGPHFGVDVRAWNTEMNENVTIVSATDGVVVEVGQKQRDDGPGLWQGFVVKVRTQHLIFVYRHLNPDKSPFKEGAPNRLLLGDRVVAGQVIGTMGKFLGDPNGTTKHLHFEIEAPVPRSVLLGNACLFEYGKPGKRVTVRVCTAREKAPPFPSLIVSYLGERYGRTVPLNNIDSETGLPSLPKMPEFEKPSTASIAQR